MNLGSSVLATPSLFHTDSLGFLAQQRRRSLCTTYQHMKKFNLLTCIVSIFVSASTHAATGTITIINPHRGTYLYSVYERHGGSVGGDVDIRRSAQQQEIPALTTTYIEIVETPKDIGKPAAVSAIGSIPIVGGVLRSDVILEAGFSEVWNQPGIVQVNPMSTLQTLAEDGERNQSDIILRKYGSTIFDNAADLARIINIIKEIKARVGIDDGDHVLLSLPDDLQRIVNDAHVKGSRVIIIIRTIIQERGKGLNAVNVKLA